MVNDCTGSSVEYSCPSVCVCVENFKDIKIGNVNIQPVNYVNVLGLYLDNRLLYMPIQFSQNTLGNILYASTSDVFSRRDSIISRTILLPTIKVCL